MLLLLAALGSAWRPLPAFADGPTAASELPAAGQLAPEPSLAEVAPEIVATVNGAPIHRDELAAICIHFDGKAALETLIEHELIRQEAAKQGVTASEEEVQAYIKKSVQEQLDARARMDGAKDFADWAARNNLKPDEAARRVRQEEDRLRPLAAPELLARKILLKSVNVTEEDVRAEFDRLYGPKAKVLQIALRSEADAQDVIKKLNLGADFADMAREVSVDNVSRRKGGEIPPLGRGSPLGDAAFNLKPGQFSQLIRTPDGIHIVKLLEMIPAADKHLEEVKGEIRESLTTRQLLERREKWIEELFDKAAIQRRL
jgi:foldase protein PrsA